MATTMPVIANLCDCSSNLPLYKPCTPQSGSNCIQTLKCQINKFPYQDISFGCTSFDDVAIERRIQNQSRMPSSQFRSALEDVTVAQGILSFKGTPQQFTSMSSRVWGNPNYLRNQSARSGAFITPTHRKPAFGLNVGSQQLNISGYVNVPTRGNSTRSTITGNRPGAMTPGGQGVDVKHGSYDRYLAKKKGTILTKPSQTVTQSHPFPLLGYRRGFNDKGHPQHVYDSATINNMSYKFSPVSLNPTCKGNEWCLWGSLGDLILSDIPFRAVPGPTWSYSLAFRQLDNTISGVDAWQNSIGTLLIGLETITQQNKVDNLINTWQPIIIITGNPLVSEPSNGFKWIIIAPPLPPTGESWARAIGTPPPATPIKYYLYSSPPPSPVPPGIANIGTTGLNTVATSTENVLSPGEKLWIYKFNLAVDL